ncbi:putative P-loop nucleoside triphosphate hydrolase, partial [Rhizoctonia solani 123E]
MPYSGQAKPDSISKANEDEVNTENTSLENVRTLASTEYFDDWSGHGAWPIVLSNRAYGDLRQLQRRDGHSCRMVGKKIKELSQGFFSNDNQKRLKGLKAEVPIYEAKVSRDLRIVYQIDIDTDVKRQSVRQIIKIYGVYTHAQMDNRLWSLVSRYHALRHGKEYRDQCSARETARTPGNNVTLPVEFSLSEESESAKEQQSNVNSSIDYAMNDDDLSAVRSTVVFEKFMLMSKDLVKSIVEDLDGAHVFQVSPKEKEVIYHDSASFVLGRSGTGKTTCIVFKMLGVERRFEEGDEAKPRQIFITQSPALAKKVQEYYCSLIKTYSHRSAPRDHIVPEDKGILADSRDDDMESLGLPTRYSLLEDQHFPLFLSFDQFCTLLEEDYIYKFGRSARLDATARRFDPDFTGEIAEEYESDPEYYYEKLLPAVRKMEQIKKNKHASMTFDVFVLAYWPHFNQSLTCGLDPALVYNEIIGIIQGSEGTLNSESGVLSRDEYLGLGRGNSLLSLRREDIYTLYESYCKAGGQCYDAAERTHTLLVATRNGRHIPGPKVDALYIDEVQDNLLIDNKLLFNFCNNPHGILMAGDTAQTISAGSSFRFEDLKAFFWRVEDLDKAVRAKKRKHIQPVLFHLSVNYRSHGGIVNCASALVELVSQLFPDSIDKLQRETGLIEGPKPIFFSGWEHGSIQIDRFIRDQGDIPIDFGANQVILVRNDAAREALRAQVGEIGLILTLYESKGLEFNDVLLYNFFEDSVASATTWRIILCGLERSKYRSLPQFDAVRHAIICSELKNLYEYWTERNLIEQCGPGDPIPQLSASSSESEWEAQGRTLFGRELYPQAMLCFRKAGLTLEHDITAAYEARKQARLLQATKSNNRESQTAFCQVAEMFIECGKNATYRQQDSCYLRAADCYLQAEEWKLAAETFIAAREFGLAAKNFRRAGCFADAVDTIKTYQEAIPESIVEEIRKVARLEYLRTDQYDQAEELFSDLEEQLDYMEVCGLESGRIHVLEQHQRHEAAAEAAAEAEFDKGSILEGIHLLQSSNDAKLLRRAVEKALDGLWLLYPLRCQIDAMDNPAAEELIQCLINLSKILTEEETHQ